MTPSTNIREVVPNSAVQPREIEYDDAGQLVSIPARIEVTPPGIIGGFQEACLHIEGPNGYAEYHIIAWDPSRGTFFADLVEWSPRRLRAES